MSYDGVLLPLTTPYRDGAVAAQQLGENIRRYEAHGVAGYLLLGSTGEAPLLTEIEKLELFDVARATIPAQRPVLVGVGLEATDATCRLARRMGERGATAVLVVTPSYYRASMSEDALVSHYTAVAEASPVPVMLYNVPVFTGVVIPVAAVARLAEHENVIGLKDSSGDLSWMNRVLAEVGPEFIVLSGSATTFLAALGCGARGAILAMADALPEPFVAIHRLEREGRRVEAVARLRALIPAIHAIAGRYGTAGVKAAMDLRGLHGGMTRPPLGGVPGEAAAEIRSILEALASDGLIDSIRL